jgi:putative ABC transport system permease protein
MVQGDVIPVVAAGLVAGLVTAVLATRLIAGLLHDVGATDPAVLGGVTALLAVVAWLASWVPARRTTKVDPMATMRGE